ncbi:hypothetical protein [Tolypothrix sp. NIES-4075]|uniref:hypothetical protein n=1 Tax=Tolypothrix sp. NIES-4075 TaxID=2005459 RepID=UPI001357E141|nr:hypothetical protein [Tolypothrix sp. NIES-4075]
MTVNQQATTINPSGSPLARLSAEPTAGASTFVTSRGGYCSSRETMHGSRSWGKPRQMLYLVRHQDRAASPRNWLRNALPPQRSGSPTTNNSQLSTINQQLTTNS